MFGGCVDLRGREKGAEGVEDREARERNTGRFRREREIGREMEDNEREIEERVREREPRDMHGHVTG